MNKEIINKIHTVVVHSGKFHADDIFTVAYLKKYFSHFKKEIKYIRTLNITEDMTLENGYIVADIGLTKFDHHQKEEDKEHREDGIAYAAFGLVAKYFHEDFLTEDEYLMLDKLFIHDLDDHDNYGTQNQLTAALGAFNLNWDEPKSKELENKRFDEALLIAGMILDKMILKAKSTAAAKEIADKAVIEKGKIIYLDHYVPIDEFFRDNDRVEFIGFWHDRGVYSIMTINDSEGKNKHLFPKKFRGFSNAKEPNNFGITFCHASGFLAAFVNKEIAKHFMENYEF